MAEVRVRWGSNFVHGPHVRGASSVRSRVRRCFWSESDVALRLRNHIPCLSAHGCAHCVVVTQKPPHRGRACPAHARATAHDQHPCHICVRARAPALFCAIPSPLHFSTVFRQVSVTGAAGNKTSLEHLLTAQSTHHSPRDRLRSHRRPHANLHVEIFLAPTAARDLGHPELHRVTFPSRHRRRQRTTRVCRACAWQQRGPIPRETAR